MIHTKHPTEMIPIKFRHPCLSADKLQCTAKAVSVITPAWDRSDKNCPLRAVSCGISNKIITLSSTSRSQKLFLFHTFDVTQAKWLKWKQILLTSKTKDSLKYILKWLSHTSIGHYESIFGQRKAEGLGCREVCCVDNHCWGLLTGGDKTSMLLTRCVAKCWACKRASDTPGQVPSHLFLVQVQAGTGDTSNVYYRRDQEVEGLPCFI